MHNERPQSLTSRRQEREGKLKAVERIARLRIGPQISFEELMQEIDHARAEETERGLTENAAPNPP